MGHTLSIEPANMCALKKCSLKDCFIQLQQLKELI